MNGKQEKFKIKLTGFSDDLQVFEKTVVNIDSKSVCKRETDTEMTERQGVRNKKSKIQRSNIKEEI